MNGGDDKAAPQAGGVGSAAPMRAAARYCAIVLVLSSSQLITTLFDEVPAAIEGVALLVGGGLSPLWAAILCARLDPDVVRIRRLLAGTLRPAVPLHLAFVALSAPTAALLVIVSLPWVTISRSDLETPAAPTLAIGLLAGTAFAIAENVGWRTWLQRHLDLLRPKLLVGFAIGLVWALWHAPLFVESSGTIHAQLPFIPYAAVVVAASVLLTELYRRSAPSLLLVAVTHVWLNVQLQVLLTAVDQSQVAATLWSAAVAIGTVGAVLHRPGTRQASALRR